MVFQRAVDEYVSTVFYMFVLNVMRHVISSISILVSYRAVSYVAAVLYLLSSSTALSLSLTPITQHCADDLYLKNLTLRPYTFFPIFLP